MTIEIHGTLIVPAVITALWAVWLIYQWTKPVSYNTIGDYLSSGFAGLLEFLTVIPILLMWVIWLVLHLYGMP